MPEKSGFTGRTRRRGTTWRVVWGDRCARFFITLGGIGTVIAVIGVFAFLFSVVVPLWKEAELTSAKSLDVTRASNAVARSAIDETGGLAWMLDENGRVHVVETTSGKEIQAFALVEGKTPSAVSYSPVDESIVLGFADGTARRGRLTFDVQPMVAADVPEIAKSLPERGAVVVETRIVQKLPDAQYKSIGVVATIEPEVVVAKNTAIRAIDHSMSNAGFKFVALLADGTVHLVVVDEQKNFMTKEVVRTTTEGRIALPTGAAGPDRVFLTGLGDNIWAVKNDGLLWRIDARKVESLVVAETFDLIPERDTTLTAVEWLNGRNTLIVGDAKGRLSGVFRSKPHSAKTSDGAVLVRGHTFEPGAAAVTAIAPSVRSRLVVVAYADGSIRLIQSTSDDVVGRSKSDLGTISSIAMSPKQDQVLAVGSSKIECWHLEAHHPEATFHSLFRKVWYEDAEHPAHVWQSSSGTDDSEAKLGLMPLVFGTLKATLYSLFFGLPIALLAAIFTSEFMHPRTRARVKPAVELMASLPSVVLGFIAGLVIAPLVENVIASVIAGVFVLPLVFLTGAYVWQILPRAWTLRFDAWRIIFILALVPIGVLAAGAVGPVVERWLFAGDVRSWLDGKAGTAAGGWIVLLSPVAAILVALVGRRFLYPMYQRHAALWSRRGAAIGELAIFVTGLLVTIGVAAIIGYTLQALGFDARGSVFATYDTRNALIVGIVMGFAIIPIIYTIAEDALAAVPEHLRAASLGAGATRWQTATRIVIPTAMSGIFSAVMVGLGRAVGETMIVLMAAGNTPIMSWNVFNGFRTLSANIATELPEAVRGSTHYRTLFLAALVLLAMTFVLNTIAEVVRRRFKKRTVQL